MTALHGLVASSRSNVYHFDCFCFQNIARRVERRRNKATSTRKVSATCIHWDFTTHNGQSDGRRRSSVAARSIGELEHQRHQKYQQHSRQLWSGIDFSCAAFCCPLLMCFVLAFLDLPEDVFEWKLKSVFDASKLDWK